MAMRVTVSFSLERRRSSPAIRGSGIPCVRVRQFERTRREIPSILLGQGLRTSAPVADHVRRFARGDQLAGRLVPNLVAEMKDAALRCGDPRADNEKIVKM